MKVIMYKSTDGALHESAIDCAKRDAVLAAAPAIEQSLMSAFEAQDKNASVSLADVSKWACANAEVLIPILSAFLPPKTRKTREPGATRQSRKKTESVQSSEPNAESGTPAAVNDLKGTKDD